MFRYPLSLNSLEVTGLNVQLIVLSTTVYWKLTGVSVAIDCAIYDDQPLKKAQALESGELDDCKPLDQTGYWLGVVALVLPSLFVAMAALLMATVGYRRFKGRKKANQQRQLLVDSPRPKQSLLGRLRTAAQTIRRGLSAVQVFQAFKNAAKLRPASASSSAAGGRDTVMAVEDVEIVTLIFDESGCVEKQPHHQHWLEHLGI